MTDFYFVGKWERTRELARVQEISGSGSKSSSNSKDNGETHNEDLELLIDCAVRVGLGLTWLDLRNALYKFPGMINCEKRLPDLVPQQRLSGPINT